MPSVRIGQTEVAYELRRAATICERRITVTPGGVEVLALATDDEAAIEGFLQRKRRWLFETLRQMEEGLAKRPVVPRLMSGSKVPFRGRQTGLKVRRHDGPHVEVAYRNGITVDLPNWVADDAAEAVVAMEIKLWLKRRVRRDVHEIAAAYERRYGLKPRSIRVAEFVTGWGSCTPNGTVHIDWRLVFAPKLVLEYVVVHELAHLRHRSHGDEFWSFLRTLLPDFERAKGWLDLHQNGLDASFLDRRVDRADGRAVQSGSCR